MILNEKISVIIIVYNTSKYVYDCIKSVINQTYKNIEIIVVNDGSTDNSSEIIRNINDDRIIFIDRKENKGPLYTRLEGVKNSSSNYIVFIDSDDLLFDNSIELLYDYLKKYKVDIVKGNFASFANDNINMLKKSHNENIQVKKRDFDSYVYDLLFKTISLNTMCGMLIKKDCLPLKPKNDTRMVYGEDILYNLELYDNINSILFINNYTYIYRYNPDSISMSINTNKLLKKLDNVIVTYDYIYNYIHSLSCSNEELYKKITIERLLNYVTQILIDLSYSLHYKEFKIIYDSTVLNNILLKYLDKHIDNKLNINKLVLHCRGLLKKNKRYSFYIYAKFIIRPLKLVKRKFL